jgi:penicillin-insensitive murein endopeptidase
LFPSTVRPAPLAAAIVSTFLTVSLGAWPGPGPRKQAVTSHVVAATGPLHFGKSVGSPTDGKLVGGAHVDESPYLRISPVHSQGDVRWGLEPLVTALDRAARAVRRQFPDAVATVGHLSRAGGGEIDRHHSHESGRDADVQFYMRNRAGKPLLSNGFVSFKPDGTTPSYPGAYFDDVRNWVFVNALVTDPQARVSHIFVAAPLRARLLAIAEHLGAPHAVRMRAAEVMVQPRGALPHDDHFHVRIACPSRMQGCVEYPSIAIARAPLPRAPFAPFAHGRQRGQAASAPNASRAHTNPAPHRPALAAPPRAAPPSTPPVAPKDSGETDAHEMDAPAMIVDDADGPID